jgi:hypothetical protein
MPPCHARSSIDPIGATTSASRVIVRDDPSESLPATTEVQSCDCCDYCGSARVEWRKCKLVCVDCRQINKSCADL